MKWNALSLRLPLLATALAISVSGVAAACDKNESAATSSEKKSTVAASSCCMKAAAAAAACQKKTEPAAVTQAAANTAQPTATEPSATASAPMDAGMRAYIDPETGLVTSVPPPGAIQPTAEQPEVEPVQIRLPDGSYMLDMKGSNVEYMVIKRDADGKPVVECTKDPKAATAAPAAPKREEK
jgi:hypothetical protein